MLRRRLSFGTALIPILALAACTDDPERLATSCGSRDEAACARLAEIARGHEEAELRVAAAGRITDAAVLAEVTSDPLPAVRQAAVGALSDQPALLKLARDSPHADVQKAAAGRLTDQALLAEIVMDADFDTGIAEIAVQQLGDAGLARLEERSARLADGWKEMLRSETRLLRLVVEQELPQPEPGQRPGEALPLEQDLRALFGRRLTGAPVSAVLRVRFEGSPIRQRYMANPPGSGPDPLAYSGATLTARVCVELAEEPLNCRNVAGRRRPPSMVRAARHVHPYQAPFDEAYRQMAPKLVSLAQEMTGERLASGLVVGAAHWRLREAAVGHIYDQELLARVAREDREAKVRLATVPRLEDRGVVAEMASNDKDDQVRAAAVKRTVDPEVLLEVALNDLFQPASSAAIDRIEDPAALARVAEESRHTSIRNSAKRRLRRSR